MNGAHEDLLKTFGSRLGVAEAFLEGRISCYEEYVSGLVDKITLEAAKIRLEMKRDERITKATAILTGGLKYYEHDGHSMPKKVSRDALVELGVPLEKQP